MKKGGRYLVVSTWSWEIDSFAQWTYPALSQSESDVDRHQWREQNHWVYFLLQGRASDWHKLPVFSDASANTSQNPSRWNLLSSLWTKPTRVSKLSRNEWDQTTMSSGKVHVNCKSPVPVGKFLSSGLVGVKPGRIKILKSQVRFFFKLSPYCKLYA